MEKEWGDSEIGLEIRKYYIESVGLGNLVLLLAFVFTFNLDKETL